MQKSTEIGLNSHTSPVVGLRHEHTEDRMGGFYEYASRAEAAADAGLVWDETRQGYYDPEDYCQECGDHDCTCDDQAPTAPVTVPSTPTAASDEEYIDDDISF